MIAKTCFGFPACRLLRITSYVNYEINLRTIQTNFAPMTMSRLHPKMDHALETQMARKPMLLTAIAIASQLTGFPVMAFDTGKLGQGGSLTLDEIMPLIAASNELRAQVKRALAERKKKRADILCDGMRFPGQWTQLGGARVSPYSCDFGGRWLQIEATVRITDSRGRAFEAITPEALKNAATVRETKPTWKWTTEDPSKNN
jgi:hypothetical protein